MRTRRSQSSSEPVSPEKGPFDGAQGRHRTVLLHEAVEYLALRNDDIVVDATLGGAGHAESIASKLSREGHLIGFDLDESAIERAEVALKDSSPRVTLIEANFRDMAAHLNSRGIPHITKALFDLGWSSYQQKAGRGFSFMHDEPLSMNYATRDAKLTAATIVNTWSESSIADILWGWGEERYARRFAKAIAEARAKAPIATSGELARIIQEASPQGYRRGKIHPATRSFQALRIAVNDELGAIEEGLKGAWEMLEPGGRIAVITFHSIEDRLVKRTFQALENTREAKRVLKKPLMPSEEELSGNPRSRSAKLRVIEKLLQSH